MLWLLAPWWTRGFIKGAERMSARQDHQRSSLGKPSPSGFNAIRKANGTRENGPSKSSHRTAPGAQGSLIDERLLVEAHPEPELLLLLLLLALFSLAVRLYPPDTATQSIELGVPPSRALGRWPTSRDAVRDDGAFLTSRGDVDFAEFKIQPGDKLLAAQKVLDGRVRVGVYFDAGGEDHGAVVREEGN